LVTSGDFLLPSRSLVTLDFGGVTRQAVDQRVESLHQRKSIVRAQSAQPSEVFVAAAIFIQLPVMSRRVYHSHSMFGAYCQIGTVAITSIVSR
jgi:hypothetical protein